MKLWRLERATCDYDEMLGFVIRAKTALDARRIASEKRGTESKIEWLDVLKSTCVEIEQEGEECVILDSFNAG